MALEAIFKQLPGEFLAWSQAVRSLGDGSLAEQWDQGWGLSYGSGARGEDQPEAAWTPK